MSKRSFMTTWWAGSLFVLGFTFATPGTSMAAACCAVQSAAAAESTPKSEVKAKAEAKAKDAKSESKSKAKAKIKSETKTKTPRASARSKASEASAAPSTYVIEVGGMTCGGCAMAVEEALSKIKGVKTAKVAFKDKEAKVELADASLEPALLVKAVEATGFTAKVKVSPKSAKAEKKTTEKAKEKTAVKGEKTKPKKETGS